MWRRRSFRIFLGFAAVVLILQVVVIGGFRDDKLRSVAHAGVFWLVVWVASFGTWGRDAFRR